MAQLIHASNMSLDGYTEDVGGAPDWAPPDDDVIVFITAVMRSAGTYLSGRRTYEALAAAHTVNTRLERHVDPRAVRDLRAAASSDLLVGGP